MAKELPVTGKRKSIARKRRSTRLIEAQFSDTQSFLAGLSRQVGNRAVTRLMLNQASGEFSSRDRSLAQIRQAAIIGSGRMPAIQRQLEETLEGSEVDALDHSPAAVNDGDVTLEEPLMEEYQVRGDSLAAVSAMLDPEEWGRCRWTVDYSFETAGGRASKVDITLHLTIRLPRWAGEGYQQASAEAQAEWQRMLGALRAHEERHAEIARRWAPVFKERMLKKRQARLASTHAQVLNEMEKEQKKFDKDTRHGQTEGVTLDTSIE